MNVGLQSYVRSPPHVHPPHVHPPFYYLTIITVVLSSKVCISELHSSHLFLWKSCLFKPVCKAMIHEPDLEHLVFSVIGSSPH